MSQMANLKMPRLFPLSGHNSLVLFQAKEPKITDLD